MSEKQPEYVELLGADGNKYKAKKFSPLAMRKLNDWIMTNRQNAFLSAAKRNNLDQATTIAGIAAISAEPVTGEQLIAVSENIATLVYMLYQQLLPFNPGMTEDKVDDLFGENINPTMEYLEQESGISKAGGDGDVKVDKKGDAINVNPTTPTISNSTPTGP